MHNVGQIVWEKGHANCQHEVHFIKPINCSCMQCSFQADIVNDESGLSTNCDDVSFSLVYW